MEKLKLHTPDHVSENAAKLAEIFPSCVTEARDDKGNLIKSIDFDQLRQELSDRVVDGPRERYHLDWPGKREAILAANAPIAKTLRPCREDSVDFETTKNLFIEGDNLDALKLLQETYLGKVKVIYIDPPYNVGTDRVYRDTFAEAREGYLIRSEQETDIGERLLLNPESSGRFHSVWLSMLLPRLRLARNLLREDGVIFISIDDREVDNLHRLCVEVFGESGFIGRVIWKNATDNNPTQIAVEHEYILAFCKDKKSVAGVWKSSVSEVKEILVRKGQELIETFASDEDLKDAYTKWFREHKAQLWPLDGYKFIDRGGVFAGVRGVHNPGREGYRYAVKHPVTGERCTEPLMGYRFPEETMKRLLAEDRIIFGDDHTKLIELKAYAHEFEDKLSSVIELDGRSGAYDVRTLFPEYRTAFDNPKPVKLLKRLVDFVSKDSGDLIVDFFAGSCSSGQAIMELNQADGLERRFIMIQIAEPCEPESEAYKAGVQTIAELSKERLRRAGRRLLGGGADPSSGDQPKLFHEITSKVPPDIGFRVLKIDVSNMKDVFYTPDEAKQGDLLKQIDNIREDRTPEDLLFQVLVDWGVDLALPIAQETIDGKTVFFVDGNALAACFDQDVTDDLVKEIAKRKPLRAVFRDSSYSSDSVKINVEQIFKLLAPSTEIRSL